MFSSGFAWRSKSNIGMLLRSNVRPEDKRSVKIPTNSILMVH
ncbi:MAG: hypothetical protein ACI8RA_001781 [Chlamydiales bacterium]